ncbi:MAG: glycosyltransferase family 39 protein [Anaerolineae bacterium]|nr:glycosyltransferase family 39 protein [Anaerolineae bacterium]
MSGERARRAGWEWAVVVLLLLIATWYRTYRLHDAPPGLHHDDIKNVILVERIMDGYIRIYYQENNGDEPLYHWMQAVYFAIVGAGYPEVRLLSAGTTMVGLAAIYALVRRLLGRNVALWTLAWHAVSLWSFFYGRRAVRPVLLVPMAALTGYLFVACVDDRAPPRLLSGWRGWAIAGLALGTTLYIYQPGRVAPFFFLCVVLYLAVLDRRRLARHWRGIALFFTVGLAVFAPLGIYLLGHTEDRVAQVNQPIVALLGGDPLPMLRNGLRAFGMFTVIGDPHWRQFVADTPVFELFGAILFYGGILLALRRVRRLSYAFSLIWLPVMLSPAVITEGAPNFLRAIAVLAAVYVFPALAMAWAIDRLRIGHRRWAWACAGVWVGLLAYNGWRAYDGYFVRWVGHPDVRFAYNATIVEAGLYLDQAEGLDSVVLSGLLPADLDPALVESAMRRTDLVPRWCDLRQALIYPQGTASHVIEPDYFAIDPYLYQAYMGAPPAAYERRLEDGTRVFALYPLPDDALRAHLAGATAAPVGWSGATLFPEGLPVDLAPLAWPIPFGARVEGLGYEMIDGEGAAPGEVVTLVTYWRALAPASPEAITFLHLLSPEGSVVAGYDGWGAPPNRWLAGDVVVQLHRVALPADLQPGVYPIELGWYERDTGARWTATLPGGGEVDRLLIGPLRVGSRG